MIRGDQHRGDRQNYDKVESWQAGKEPCALKSPNHSFSIKAVLRPTELNPAHPSCFLLKTHFPRTGNKGHVGCRNARWKNHLEQNGRRAGQGQMNSAGMSPGKSSKNIRGRWQNFLGQWEHFATERAVLGR